MRFARLGAATVSLVLVVLACAPATPPSTAPSGAATTGARNSGAERLIISLFPADTSDAFAATYCRGLKAAEEDFNAAGYKLKAQCQGITPYDATKFNNAIDAAVAQKPAGLIAIGLDKDSMKPHTLAAEAAGIAVVCGLVIGQDVGSTDAAEVGCFTYVGGNQYLEGRAMGDALVKAGAKNVICRNPGPGVKPFDDRCRGTTDVVTEAGGKVTQLPMPAGDNNASKNALIAALTADPTVDGLSDCESSQYAACKEALVQLGLWGKLPVAVVDINEEEANDIKAGNLIFATTQQGFLEGYMAITAIALKLQWGTVPGGYYRQLFTGPINIDKSNVDQLLPFLKTGNF